MFEGFDERRIDTGDIVINARIGGSGPPVLLLHGYPQTHAIWHGVAPRLAERFTVVCADLRGYGDSDKPPGGPQAGDPEHAVYSKRRMARDQVDLMRALGFASFAAIGHDRGGRVVHRMCLDHPAAVSRAAVIDITPTYEMFTGMNRDIAMGYWHWTWLAQPFDLPERMIGADPVWFLEGRLAGWGTGLDAYDRGALDHYRRCFADPATIHASCEDYRAAATIDLRHDEADLQTKIACPLLVLWGGKGLIAKWFEPLEVWRRRAADVRGHAIDAGHFIPEEKPDETTAALLAFLSEAATPAA